MPSLILESYYIHKEGGAFESYQTVMNGRALNPSGSQKNLMYNNIRYVKPVSFMTEDQQQARNLYYDSNPYFLNGGTTPNKPRGIYNTARNGGTILSRDNSETSSQRSGNNKMIRTNGLRMAQKPKFFKDKPSLPDRQSSQHSNHSTQSRTNIDQSRRLIDRNISLQEQNRQLFEQNRQLKQQLISLSQLHKRQIQSVERRFSQIIKKSDQLERQMEEGERQWKSKFQEITRGTSTGSTLSANKTSLPGSGSSSVLGGFVSNQPQSKNYPSSSYAQQSSQEGNSSPPSKISTNGNYIVKR